LRVESLKALENSSAYDKVNSQLLDILIMILGKSCHLKQALGWPLLKFFSKKGQPDQKISISHLTYTESK